jgi:KipI family sensor histidine kinase inhibitor
VRALEFGRDGLLVEVRSLDEAMALHDALARASLPGVVELVPAARTVLVRFDPGRTSASKLADAVSRLRPEGARRRRSDAVVEIPVVYDGDDLDEIGRLTGLDRDEVVSRHAAPLYDVAFTGFAPGFTYLAGGDPALVVPRRSSPRPSIPAGSVGIAGEFSGVYPRASPGGWQLLGRTEVQMWDVGRPDSPALLRPGSRVRFVPVSATPSRAGVNPSPQVEGSVPVGSVPDGARGDAVLVEAAGVLSTIQDLGRPGFAALGVPRSGAMDRPELRRANRLLGNHPGAAAIEHAGGGLAVRALRPLVLAVTGARVPLAVTSSFDESVRHPQLDVPFALGPGDVLEVGGPSNGVYAYVAVVGGFSSDSALGSRSADLLSGIGPAPLIAGTRLSIGRETIAAVADQPSGGPSSGAVVADVVLGPRSDWFVADALAVLQAQAWSVSPRSNRVGIRLSGERPLERMPDRLGAELPSEGMLPGAIQVPPGGQPVVFGADHPVTGGYPVIATVVPEHLGLVAQVPQSSALRFRVVGRALQGDWESR